MAILPQLPEDVNIQINKLVFDDVVSDLQYNFPQYAHKTFSIEFDSYIFNTLGDLALTRSIWFNEDLRNVKWSTLETIMFDYLADDLFYETSFYNYPKSYHSIVLDNYELIRKAYSRYCIQNDLHDHINNPLDEFGHHYGTDHPIDYNPFDDGMINPHVARLLDMRILHEGDFGQFIIF